MVDETILTALYVVGTILLLSIGFFSGRFFDPLWRCKQYRRLLRKNYVVLAIQQKDGKTILNKVINAENDIAIIGRNMWVITKGRIYREDDPKVGFKMDEKNIVWREGAPVVFVDSYSIKPLTFHADEAQVKSDEVGATILAYIFNQLAKGLAAVNQFKILLYVAIAVSGISAVIAFMALDAINNQVIPVLGTIAKETHEIYIQTVPQLPAGVRTINGTQVVDTRRLPNGG